jgi:hypothetical protein
MSEQNPQQRKPGTDIVARNIEDTGSGVPGVLLLATDLAVGAASQATHLALEAGARSWDAGVAVGRVVSALPGAGMAGRFLNAATRPLVDNGREVRVRARSSAEADTRRLIETFVPGVVDSLDVDRLVQRIDIDTLVRRIDIDELVGQIDIDALVREIDIDQLVQRIDIDELVQRIDIDTLVQRIDIDRLVQRIDIDALVQRIDIDALVRRIDIEALVRRIDIDALVRRIDIEALMHRIDIDALVGRIDVNEVVQRVDIDAVVEETAMGSIVARSTSGFASEALDAARSQTAGVDTLVSRAVNRMLRRREEDLPAGPPLLTSEAVVLEASPAPGAEPAALDTADEDEPSRETLDPRRQTPGEGPE